MVLEGQVSQAFLLMHKVIEKSETELIRKYLLQIIQDNYLANGYLKLLTMIQFHFFLKLSFDRMTHHRKLLNVLNALCKPAPNCAFRIFSH